MEGGKEGNYRQCREGDRAWKEAKRGSIGNVVKEAGRGRRQGREVGSRQGRERRQGMEGGRVWKKAGKGNRQGREVGRVGKGGRVGKKAG